MHRHDNRRKSDKGKSKDGSFQLDKEGTQQWRTVDLVVTSNSWGTCWLSSIGRSELTFQMVMLRHWSSQQYPYCYSVFHVLPFCSFPYMQNSIYTSFSKNGFEHLTFPSNKAGALMNIAKPSLGYNLLWVSSRYWVVEFKDIYRAIHLLISPGRDWHVVKKSHHVIVCYVSQ